MKSFRYIKLPDSLRAGLALVMSLGVLVRPGNVEALLIHGHGEFGSHAHAVALLDIRECCTDGPPEDCHMDSPAGETACKTETGDHEFDCGEAECHGNHALDQGHSPCSSILIIFENLSGPRTTVRADMAGATSPLAIWDVCPPASFSLSSSGPGGRPHFPPEPAREFSRCIDAILQSSQAILV